MSCRSSTCIISSAASSRCGRSARAAAWQPRRARIALRRDPHCLRPRRCNPGRDPASNDEVSHHERPARQPDEPHPVIDDSEAVRGVEVLLSIHGVRTLTAASPAEGSPLSREPVHLVIGHELPARATGGEGVRLFRPSGRSGRNCGDPLTAWTRLRRQSSREGRRGRLRREIREDARLRNLLDLQRAQADVFALRKERAAAREKLAARHDLCGIVYASERMHTLVAMAAQVAHADVPVLITGPNGAGKEVVSDIVQANSAVRGGPYIKVNIGALPNDLIEAELFGTETGAFTGARARPGRFEAADGGTLLLDELGNLSASGQSKLARVLQTASSSARIEPDAARAREARRGHQHQPAPGDPRGPLSRGPLLPPERDRTRTAAARGAAGIFCRSPATSSIPTCRSARCRACPRAARLARQRT